MHSRFLRCVLPTLLLLFGATAQAAVHGDTLKAPGKLYPGDVMYSKNRVFRLSLDPSAGLRIERLNGQMAEPVWHSGLKVVDYGQGPGPFPAQRLELTRDGRLAVYTERGYNSPLWESTPRRSLQNGFMILQDDGNLCVYGEIRGVPCGVWCRF